MKHSILISIFLIIVLILFSCTTKEVKNETLEIDQESMPTKMEMDMPFNANNKIVSFESSLDESEYLKSVSSKSNPYTLYNEADLPTSYVFEDKVLTAKDGKIKESNDSTTSYNYIITDSNLESITISSDTVYMITFSNTSVKATTTPALILKGDGKCFINLAGSTTIEDSIQNEKKGAITSSSDVIIFGEGDLSLTANKKHGFKIDGELRILSGSINITTTKSSDGNAISVDTYYIQDGGNVTIFATNDTYGSENKGIKVNGTEERESGKLVINGGRLYIESVDKGISAGWKLAEDAETETTSDDPDPSLYINNGVITIITTGTIYEVSEEESLSPEGIEAKNNLVINGGLIQVSTSDDSLNAGSLIEINGGYIFCQSRDADAVDSNGLINISGGVLIALGSDAPEMGIDCDSSQNFSYTGGTIIAISGANNNAPDSVDTTGYVIRENLTGNSFALLDKDENVIIAYAVPTEHESKNAVMIASDDISLNSTYYFISNATLTGNNIFNGIISNNNALGDKKEIVITNHINGESQEMGRGRMMEGFDPSRMTPPEGFDKTRMTPPDGFKAPPKGFKEFKK